MPRFVVATQLEVVQAWDRGEITLKEFIARTGWDLGSYDDDDLASHHWQVVSYIGEHHYGGCAFVGHLREFIERFDQERQVLQMVYEAMRERLEVHGGFPGRTLGAFGRRIRSDRCRARRREILKGASRRPGG
ncbi:hypothetical protein ACQPYK_49420 (plasmid) [Streptosporangium sp. CA-135522]|uniref:hypothetical protein n=1 Tax=Streptosporangium sp. CA-135522 TaxID=3240072 RepID=UPI003D9099A6